MTKCTVKKGKGKVVCCPSNLSMNSPAGVFPNRTRPASDRNERRSDRAERKPGGESKYMQNKEGAWELRSMSVV